MNKGKQKLVEKRVTAASMKELKKLVGDMYWDYDRMSSSGQETLDKIADIPVSYTHLTLPTILLV